MNILEEFWYGNIEPTEYDTSPNKEYKETLQLISRNEEKLLATMTDEQKDLFSRYQDCVREFQAMAECLLFQNSFRLGARMMLEVMQKDKLIINYRIYAADARLCIGGLTFMQLIPVGFIIGCRSSLVTAAYAI